MKELNIHNRSVGAKILFFIIWPFGAFLLSLKNLKSKASLIVFFLFCVLFGFTFLPQNESADSYRYAEDFKELHNNYSWFEYSNDLNEYSKFDSKIKDIYVITCSYIVIAVSGNYHLFMALFAFVFAYFYLKSFSFLVNRSEFQISIFCYLLAFLFTFSNPIFNINGVRFWTASWIAVYVLFQILVNKNYRYLLLAIITPLIHISFIIYLIIIIIYFLLKKFEKAWFILFFISFFLTNIILLNISNLSGYLPKTIQNILFYYTDASFLSGKVDEISSLPFYARALNSLPYYYLNGIMIIFIFNFKKIKQNVNTNLIFIFLLIWMSFVNMTWGIPSVGNRFIALAIPIISYLIVISYKQIPIFKKIVFLIPFVYSYAILDWFRNMISISDPYLYLSTLVHIIYKNL